MVFGYGLTNGSNRQTCVMYAKRHHEHNTPPEKLFGSLFQRLADMGTFAARTTDRGRPCTVRTPYNEERMMGHVEHDPEISVRRIEAVESINHSLAWSVTTVLHCKHNHN